MSLNASEPFLVTDDKSAEWCIRKIREAQAEKQRWRDYYAEQQRKIDQEADGTISGGMIPKVNSCVDAIEKGVRRVHILNGTIPHPIILEIFTDRGIGTMFEQPKAAALSRKAHVPYPNPPKTISENSSEMKEPSDVMSENIDNARMPNKNSKKYKIAG